MDKHNELPLSSLVPGSHAAVVRIVGGGEDPIAQRLGDLGFWPGTPVRVVRQAPLGDPVQYALRGYHLALRRSEAGRVLVRPIAGPARP